MILYCLCKFFSKEYRLATNHRLINDEYVFVSILMGDISQNEGWNLVAFKFDDHERRNKTGYGNFTSCQTCRSYTYMDDMVEIEPDAIYLFD